VDVWAELTGEENPVNASMEAPWPFDPLGERRAAFALAAERVLTVPRRRKTQWTTEADLLLAERDELARRAALTEVAVPDHLSVSQLVALKKDRRPWRECCAVHCPAPPTHTRGAARPFTGGSRNVMAPQRFSTSTTHCFDEEEAPDSELAALKAAFEASVWADRVPVEVETPFILELAGVVIRGRMDAVFASVDGGYEVVDWKTGKPPRGGRRPGRRRAAGRIPPGLGVAQRRSGADGECRVPLREGQPDRSACRPALTGRADRPHYRPAPVG
jgi:DNA helicase-2/ATP-dependent DNA helicase PcrA